MVLQFEHQKSDDKSKFGGLWVAHVQNRHQTQGLLEMDIQSLNLKGLKMHTAYTVYRKLKLCFSKKINVSGRTPFKNIPNKEETVSQGVFF